MHYSLLVVTVVLASTVSALPNNWPPSCQSFTDTFENITASITGRTPVGTYHDVTYQAWNLAQKSALTGTTDGVIPHSGSQDIVTGVGTDATQLGSVTLNPFGNIIASPSKAFDLYSFWFGCALGSQQPIASTSLGCVLSVVGFTTDGTELPVVTFSYAPSSPTSAPMVLASLPSTYSNLKNVTIGVAAGTGLPDNTAILVDDVSHCNYS